MLESRMRLDSRAQTETTTLGRLWGRSVGWISSHFAEAVPALHGPAPLTCGPRATATGRKCQPRSSLPVRSSRPSPTHFRDALDHREASVSVVSRSLRSDHQARKLPRSGSSLASRTTKATGNPAFPEERKPQVERRILGAMAGRARTGGWVKRHLAVGSTQGPPVAGFPFPSLWTLPLARVQNLPNLEDFEDEI